MQLPSDAFKARLAASRQKAEQLHKSTALTTKPSAAPVAAQRKRQLKPTRQPAESDNKHRTPPHADEAEQAVLSAMLQWPDDCVPEARRLLTRDYFFNPINAELFTTMLSLFDAGKAESKRWLIGFTQFLRDSNRLDAIGGPSYVTNLATIEIAQSSLSFYAEMLRDKLARRELITLGSKLVRASYGSADEEAGEIIDDFAHWLERIKYGASSLNGSEPQTIQVLQAFNARHDPNTLIGRRWLVRGGTSLWAGGSGYGKSTLEMQLAIYWGCGRECFGLGPYRPAKSLIVQAENDLGDMSEQLQGVISGIAATKDINFEESKALIEQNVIIHRVVGKTGSSFLALLDSLIQETRCDFVWIDPLFAFAGCDLMNSEKTGRFLREGLFPIVVKRNVSLQVLHHVGKPVRAGDSDDEGVAAMSEIDYQYLGFGTSEIQNAFRAVNVIVPIAGTHVYKLVLSKRGERAGAKDVDGNWTRTLFLEHSKEGLCWLLTEAPEVKTKGRGRPPDFALNDILDEMSVTQSIKTNALLKRLHDERNMSRATFFRFWEQAHKESRIVRAEDGGWVRSSQS